MPTGQRAAAAQWRAMRAAAVRYAEASAEDDAGWLAAREALAAAVIRWARVIPVGWPVAVPVLTGARWSEVVGAAIAWCDGLAGEEIKAVRTAEGRIHHAALRWARSLPLAWDGEGVAHAG